VQQFLADMENRTLFFSLWWKDLDEDNAKRLMGTSGDYRYYLEEMRHFKPHTLSEPEEKVINLKNVTGSDALITLYSTITSRYVFKLEVEGETKELTRGQLMAYVQGPDPDLRAAGYQELYKVFGNDGLILGQMYQTRVRDWRNENLTLRKFSSPIAVRNLGNDIPDKAVDTLLDVARKNAGIFQRYFKMKARVLSMEKLRRYDIYAPVAKAEKPFEYASAAQMVLDSFSEFDPKVGDLARRVFDQDHMDSEVRKGKRDGAFCWSVTPEMTPWVLLNYQGRARDVATMAHELGHAIHSMLASHHSAFTFHSSLPLAETASTFGEMMLTDRLLAEESDETVRRDILFKQVDDAYATIMRQSYFALFEKQAHEMVVKNASVDELAAAYMENLSEQFGDSLELSRLRLCLRAVVGALALPAVQTRGRSLQAQVSQAAFGRGSGVAGQDFVRGRDRYRIRSLLAGRVRCGRWVGKAVRRIKIKRKSENKGRVRSTRPLFSVFLNCLQVVYKSHNSSHLSLR
jgi:oligoendopeptidase F